jgi:hypothetical protein
LNTALGQESAVSEQRKTTESQRETKETQGNKWGW